VAGCWWGRRKAAKRRLQRQCRRECSGRLWRHIYVTRAVRSHRASRARCGTSVTRRLRATACFDDPEFCRALKNCRKSWTAIPVSYLAPGTGATYCHLSVCLSICMQTYWVYFRFGQIVIFARNSQTLATWKGIFWTWLVKTTVGEVWCRPLTCWLRAAVVFQSFIYVSLFTIGMVAWNTTK